MHYRRIDLIESIDCIRYALTTYWSFQTEQHKKKEVVASPTFEASTQSLVLVARCYNFSLARPSL